MNGYDNSGAAVQIGEAMPVQIDNCIFIGNTATNHGGAVVTGSGNGEITNCLFVDNVAEEGGALYHSYYNLDIEHCTFVRNSAVDGGAIYMEWADTASVMSCTFAFNYADKGSGIHLTNSTGAAIEIHQTIIAFGVDGQGFHWDGEGIVGLSSDVIHGNEGGDWIDFLAGHEGVHGNADVYPMFCDALGDDFTLMDGSYCLPENNPGGVLIGAHDRGCDLATAVAGAVPERSGRMFLANHPNPFNPRTTISFGLGESGRATVGVYDISGRLVRLVADEDYGPGPHAVDWHGRDGAGRSVSSGTYFVVLRTASGTETRKISLLR